jgi:hypothetical protein
MLGHIVTPLCALGCAGPRYVGKTQFTDNWDVAARGGFGPLFGWLVVERGDHRAARFNVGRLSFLADADLAFG